MFYLKESQSSCSECEGRGIKVRVTRMGPIMHKTQTTCNVCNGEGQTIPEKDRCKNCLGRKKVFSFFTFVQA